MELSVLGMWGPYPAPGGACSGYLLSSGETNLVLDLGPGCLSRIPPGVGPSGVDAFIISHLHWDHFADLLVLRYALDIEGKSAPLYSPGEPEAESGFLHYKGVFQRHFPREGEPVSIGDMEVNFHRVDHPVPTYGVRLTSGGRTFAYSADTGPSKSVRELALGADLFLCEANLLESQDAPGHLKASDAARIALDAGVGTLLLTHVAPVNDRRVLEKEAKRVFDSVSVAREGQTYQV